MSETALAVTPGERLGADAWDQLLLAQPEANLLQSWKWGELQSRFGWSVERLVFHEGHAGVCSVQRSATLFPGGAVYYVPRGPVVAERDRLLVLDALERRATDGRGLILRVEPNALVGDEWPAFFEGRGFTQGKAVQPEATRCWTHEQGSTSNMTRCSVTSSRASANMRSSCSIPKGAS